MFNSKIKPYNLSIYVEYHRLRKKESSHPKAVLFTGSLIQEGITAPPQVSQRKGAIILFGERGEPLK